MAELVPADWRRALADLKDNIKDALSRWFSRESRPQEPESSLEVQRAARLPRAFFSGAPLVDLEETDDELIVSAELPGFAEKDFAVELTGERLVIRGEKKNASEKQGAGYYYAERSYGSFARAIALPCEIDREGVKARFKNGVLTVAMPKTERAKAKQVRIEVD